MKLNTILHRYLFTELLPTFVISVVFFTFIFLMAKILDITNLIVNYSIKISTVALMLLYSMPSFLQFVIPLAVMVSVLLSLLRLSVDNEIVAMKSGGISIYQMLAPILFFCLLGSIFTFLMTAYGTPLGRAAAKRLGLEVVTTNVDIGLKERIFNDSFKDVMFYVNKVDSRNKMLLDIFIHDQRDADRELTVTAPRGKLFRGADKRTFIIRLYNGTISQVNCAKRSTHAIDFETYDFNLDLKKMVAKNKSQTKYFKEMIPSEIRQRLKKIGNKDPEYYPTLIQLHQMYSIPFACLALGLLAIPLGIQTFGVARSFSLGYALFFFILYYVLLSAGFVFGESGLYPVVLGMWVPNLVIGGIGIYLLKRKFNDCPVLLDELFGTLRRKFVRTEN